MPNPSAQAQPKWSSGRPLLAAGRFFVLALLVAGIAVSLRGSAETAAPSAPRHISFVANVIGPSDAQRSVPVDVYIPKGASIQRPLTVLVALHGVGGNGEEFARPLYSSADEHGWVVVAPTFTYDNWLDVHELTDDDLKAIAAVRKILGQLPAETSLRFRDQILLYGFSRGAQLAHRFAILHPSEVLGVASLSAGSYTLPATHSPESDATPLNWPLGVADLGAYAGHDFQPDLVRQIHFFVGVGTRDNQDRDVPRAWDSCSGTNRVARATAFAESLDALGAPVHFVQFPNAGHKETPEMRQAALDYLAGASASLAH